MWSTFTSAAWPSMQQLIPFFQGIVWIVLLLLLSAFFAGSETAFFSLTRTQRETLFQRTDGISKRILHILQSPQRLTSTIIIGNELVNIVLSLLVTGLFLRVLHSYISEVWVGLISTFCTVPVIVVGAELIPKTVAIKVAPVWVRWAAIPLQMVMWVLWLPRTFLHGITAGILFLLPGRSKKTEPTKDLQERELRSLVDLGTAEGEIEQAEHRMIHNVFDFGDLTVGQMMTPVQEMFSLPLDMPLSRMVEKIAHEQYARIPIYRSKPEDIIGILFTKDLVGLHQGSLQGRSLLELLHSPFFIPKRAKCERLLREFKRRKTHLALVVNEYGKLAGLITLDDLLQALFGNLQQPSPTHPASSALSSEEDPHLSAQETQDKELS